MITEIAIWGTFILTIIIAVVIRSSIWKKWDDYYHASKMADRVLVLSNNPEKIYWTQSNRFEFVYLVLGGKSGMGERCLVWAHFEISDGRKTVTVRFTQDVVESGYDKLLVKNLLEKGFNAFSWIAADDEQPDKTIESRWYGECY